MRILFTIQYSYELLKYPFGGLEVHVKNLIESMPEVEFYLLMPDYFWRNYLLIQYVDGKKCSMEFLAFGESVKQPLITSSKYQALFKEVLIRKQIDLVHIHNIIGHSYDIADVCREQQVPVVKSLHDMYDICGNYFQGNFNTRFDTAFLEHEYHLSGASLVERNELWLKQTTIFFSNIDAVIAFSQSTIDIYQKFFTFENYQLIPHGVNFPKQFLGSPTIEDKLKIIYFGRVSKEKGFDKIAEAFSNLPESQYEFHVFGMWEPYYLDLQAELAQKANVFIYGRYDLIELTTKYLPQIRPHVTVILSDWPETFNYVMTEAQLLGILPIVSAQGALLEKAQATNFAYVIENNTISDLQHAFETIKCQKEKWSEYQTNYEKLTVQTFEEMILSYRNLYQSYGIKARQNEVIPMPKYWQTLAYRVFHWVLITVSFSRVWQNSKPLREKIKKILKGKSRV